MTATTWNGHSLPQSRRRPSGDWTPLTRKELEVLGAVNELGPETNGLDMVKESEKRARALAMTSWRRFVLPDPLLTLFAYNPLKGGSVYVLLGRLVDGGLVKTSLGTYPGHPHVKRFYYSITPLGRIALAYERARHAEISKGRDTLFRHAVEAAE